jgi:hypothetical protein
MDKQLDFFITRVKKEIGFGDIQKDNIKNMEFIEEIYKAAKQN